MPGMLLRLCSVLSCALALGLPACGSGEGASGSRIPAKTVVLTFDDACRSHLEKVVPVLERHGFGATFFVTRAWMDNAWGYLGFPELKAIHDRGFEIGSHSWTHGGFHTPDAARTLPPDLEQMEAALVGAGIPRPISFAWPGGVFGPEGRSVLQDRGYLFGRRVIHPEFPPGVTRDGLVYDPTVHDPLLIPTYGLVSDSWDLDWLRTVVAKAVEGKAVVLCFHGVPDTLNPGLSTSPTRFQGMMALLAREGYRGIAMRDLRQWVDPVARPPDPLVGRRCPE